MSKRVENPARCLALGVIANAMHKAQRGDEEARQWLIGQDEWLDFWCDVANVGVQYLRERVEAITLQDEETA